MNYRRFGRAGWQVSDVGYGMWGMARGPAPTTPNRSLRSSVHRSRLQFLRYGLGLRQWPQRKAARRSPAQNSGKKLYVATKVPPKNREWPARASATVDESYPPAHIEEYVGKSLQNLGIDSLDLIQLHTWQDKWLGDTRLIAALEKLKSSGKVRAVASASTVGNRLTASKRSAPELSMRASRLQHLRSESRRRTLSACREKDVAVIARVPFDEGSLTGTLARDSKWPEGDWRNIYFSAAKLPEILARVDALKPLLRDGITLPELALRFILSNSDVATTIPGMRKIRNVEANIAANAKAPSQRV